MLDPMTQDQQAASATETPTAPTIFTAYEIDDMLTLSDTRSAEITRDQLGIPGVPGSGPATEHVTAAVNAGLRARGMLVRRGGEWVLSPQGELVATTLTTADRWLGIALAQDAGMRAAFVVKAGSSVLMLTQDDLDSFQVTSLSGADGRSAGDVPKAVARVATTFLRRGAGHTVSLRRTDIADPDSTTPLMLHVEDDGSWQSGHLPFTEDGVLSASPIALTEVQFAIADLWERGESGGR